ncbi:MAG: response regulator [Rhizobiaceae bacterium]|nr:response regulator [Rhizobiaceae bacterium]
MKIFMIVDDSPVIRKVARRILEGIGYVVSEAEDGIDALEKCANNMPDIILVDWEMPRMDGVEFINAIRSREEADQVKILFCTSEVLVTEMMKAKRAGCQGYLLKPFTKASLQQKLTEIGIEAIAA